MQLTNYQISNVPTQPLFNHLFINRLHRAIKIDKSDFKDNSLVVPESLSKQHSQMSHKSSYSQPQEEDKIYVEKKANISLRLKQKIIRKKRGQGGVQRGLHKKYVNYLMQFMHKSNLVLIKNKVPPNLSVLETRNEGDYVQDDQGQQYAKKDFPHYSNIIQVCQLPPDNRNPNSFINKPIKIRWQQTFFQLQDNCVVKLKQVYKFISILLRKSIEYGLKRKESRNNDEYDNNENHEFDVIGPQLGLTYKTCKLLYDILNQYFNLEREMKKGEQSKMRASKSIKEALIEIVSEYNVNQTVHIPHNELYISLAQLRTLLHQHNHNQQRSQSS